MNKMMLGAAHAALLTVSTGYAGVPLPCEMPSYEAPRHEMPRYEAPVGYEMPLCPPAR
jgi:hypothetical protein